MSSFSGQRGEGAEGGDAPADEGLGVLGSEGEDRQRERRERGGFFAGGDDGGGPSGQRRCVWCGVAGAEAAGEAEGGVDVGADHDAGLEAQGF
jgi:hypothetical protein